MVGSTGAFAGWFRRNESSYLECVVDERVKRLDPPAARVTAILAELQFDKTDEELRKLRTDEGYKVVRQWMKFLTDGDVWPMGEPRGMRRRPPPAAPRTVHRAARSPTRVSSCRAEGKHLTVPRDEGDLKTWLEGLRWPEDVPFDLSETAGVRLKIAFNRGVYRTLRPQVLEKAERVRRHNNRPPARRARQPASQPTCRRARGARR